MEVMDTSLEAIEELISALDSPSGLIKGIPNKDKIRARKSKV